MVFGNEENGFLIANEESARAIGSGEPEDQIETGSGLLPLPGEDETLDGSLVEGFWVELSQSGV